MLKIKIIPALYGNLNPYSPRERQNVLTRLDEQGLALYKIDFLKTEEKRGLEPLTMILEIIILTVKLLFFINLFFIFIVIIAY